VPQAVSSWPPEAKVLTSQLQRSQGNTERRIQCKHFRLTTSLLIAT
jgi:hypothetical protein